MEILIEDIPEGGLEINADLADVWFLGMMNGVLGASFESQDTASLNVSIVKFGWNVNLDGVLKHTSHPNCDRCLCHYQSSSRVPFHVVLAPLFENKRQQEDDEDVQRELVKEDLEFGYYEGDRFDLVGIVREQLILMKPMKNLCKDDCLGLCQRCGKDLNECPCGCKKEAGDPRWAPLKGFKAKKDKAKLKN